MVPAEVETTCPLCNSTKAFQASFRPGFGGKDLMLGKIKGMGKIVLIFCFEKEVKIVLSLQLRCFS